MIKQSMLRLDKSMNYDRYVFDLEKRKLASLPTPSPLNKNKTKQKLPTMITIQNSNNNHLYCTSQI